MPIIKLICTKPTHTNPIDAFNKWMPSPVSCPNVQFCHSAKKLHLHSRSKSFKWFSRSAAQGAKMDDLKHTTVTLMMVRIKPVTSATARTHPTASAHLIPSSIIPHCPLKPWILTRTKLQGRKSKTAPHSTEIYWNIAFEREWASSRPWSRLIVIARRLVNWRKMIDFW